MTAAVDLYSIPETIGPYRVITRLASGGMAEIYLAKRGGAAGFERAVVIKRMLPHLAHEPELRTTLLDEARLMSRLRHPNIVSVQEFSRDSRDFYLVMEFLRGESLSGLRRELLGRNERLDAALASLIIADVCAGLHAAHEARDEEGKLLHVVHRDVSPQNVFVTFDGEVKLLDFGIACFADRAAHTKTGRTKGKFAYMSPEQFAGEKLDRRADVFAVGAMLHELLTGKRLFARESEAQVLKAVLNDPIPLPSQVADDDVVIPEALDAICMRALARDRSERYETAEALREALRELMPQLDPRQRGRERLVELTRLVLPHRFAETESLLRRAIRPSGDSAEMPTLSLSELRAVTLSETRARPDQSDPSIDVIIDSPTSAGIPSRKSAAVRRRWFLAGGLGAGLLALCALALPWMGDAPAQSSTAMRPLAASAPLAPTSVVELAEPLPSEPEPEAVPVEPAPPASVSIVVESSPSRATVRVDGEVRGLTPLALELPRGDDPVSVTVERRGYEASEQRVLPDVDQRLVVRLQERPAARTTPRFYSFD